MHVLVSVRTSFKTGGQVTVVKQDFLCILIVHKRSFLLCGQERRISMKEVYQLAKQELLERYGGAAGHTEERAEELRGKYGENVLKEKGRKSVFRVFVEQFADLLVMILIAAAIISMLSGNAESTIVIFAVILLNAALGTVQYVKAEKSLDSLKRLSAPMARVLRDGVRREVASREIVPGDVLFLEAGDIVAADGVSLRIIPCR